MWDIGSSARVVGRGTFTLQESTSVVPEPSSLLLLVTMLGMLLLSLRRLLAEAKFLHIR